MTSKKRILLLIDWYTPGFKAGGLIKSCESIISRFSDLYDFDIFTSDRDLGDTLPYNNVELNEWNKGDYNCRIFYSSKESFSRELISLIKRDKYDTIYMNSFFSLRFTIIPLIFLRWHKSSARIVLAPRGMLGAGALAIKSLKKNVFIIISKLLNLYKSVIWHATSEIEEEEILKVMGRNVQVITADDTCTQLNLTYTSLTKKPGHLKAIFLSRISRKKNLDFALKVLLNVDREVVVDFHIYGPIEDDEYWNECLRIMANVPSNVNIHIEGEVHPSVVLSIFSNSHLFFFPTHHENFGHVIFESFAASCPVLLSDNTPWRNIEEKGAGYVFSLSDENKFIQCIYEFASMNQVVYDHWRLGAFQLAQKHLNNEELTLSYQKLFG